MSRNTSDVSVANASSPGVFAAGHARLTEHAQRDERIGGAPLDGDERGQQDEAAQQRPPAPGAVQPDAPAVVRP